MSAFSSKRLFNYNVDPLAPNQNPEKDSLADLSPLTSMTSAGPAKNPDQFFDDINRNRQHYFFNEKSVLQLMQEAKKIRCKKQHGLKMKVKIYSFQMPRVPCNLLENIY